MFRLASTPDQHSLEIVCLEVAEAAYAPGDVRLSVNVRSHGFTGNTDVWVMQEELAAFIRDITTLNTSLAGSATLRSISPGELELQVLAVSSRGHLAVQGTLGYHVYERERMYWHSVAFGFEFEPTQLEAAASARWVAESAA
jgi:hypothetical protein